MRIALLVAGVLVADASAQAKAGWTLLGNVASGNSYTDATCPNQNTCYYEVTAVDASGHESALASCATAQLCLAGNQAAVTMPSSGVHTVALSWVASTSAGVTYNVYQHVGPLPASALAAVVN
jgi:fibronectin type 3 domain-containing protein